MAAPTEPAPTPVVPESQGKPRQHAWDDDPRTCARADRDYWVDRDWPTEPDDPSDHYYC